MTRILVPNCSYVKINCTAAVGTANQPFWAIDPAADSESTTPLHFATRKGQLNAHGVYELPQIETPLTLRLLINNTAINNQTEINCEPGQELVYYAREARAQNFKPRPLINGNAFVTLMAKMKKQRWIIRKNSRFQGEQQRN